MLAKPGQFFVASNGNSVLEVPIPAPAGQYFSRAVVELDMRTGKIFVGFNATVALLRPRPDGALYFGHFVRGNNKNGPVEKTIIDVDNETTIQGPSHVWSRNSNYHLRFDYDAVAGNLTLTVVQGGQIVEQSSGHITNFDLGHDGQGMKLAFGLAKVADGAYYPPLGWSFSNLKVTLTP